MKSSVPIIVGAVSAVVAAVAPAAAAEIVDQSQASFGRGVYGVGGDVNERWAQTFTAGVTAPLVALRAPLGVCGGGDLVIDIETTGADGKPSGVVLRTTRIAALAAPVSVDVFHEFRLSSPVTVTSGVKYAFTIRKDPDGLTSFCSYAKSPPGDLYANGSVYYGSRSHPPGWTDLATTPDLTRDLAFETVVDTGPGGGGASSGDCLIPLPGGGAIPSNAPVCKCLRDEGLREFRCALLDPDFFAIRRIPWPIPAGGSYRETWEILPLTELKGAIRVTLSGANISKPIDLKFISKSRKTLETRGVTLKAPAEPAALEGYATLSYGQRQWRIDTSIPAEQVLPPGQVPGVQKP